VQDGDSSPSLVTAKSRTPRSMPTARPVPGKAAGAAASTVKVTYQRPSGSRATITIAGSSNGTEETSFRNARAGSCFMAVSARSDCAYEMPWRSACQRAWRAARVRFHTTRTQPNVRFSTACCAASG
jgi:hypothetical protein